MLPAVLFGNKYMWLMFVLFFKLFILFGISLFC